MKKTTIYLGILLTLPVLLNAQYMGGIGNGDATSGISNVPLPVQKISVELPAEYELCQNYPNPFNPVTKIKFKVASSSPYPLQRGTPVTLKVFDMLGKEVATLVNEELKAGVYEVRFDARLGGSSTDLPSGVYFYKIETGNFTETKKMTLLK